MAALLDEAKKLNLGSTAHLDQMGVVADERARRVAARPRHPHALLRSLRGAAQGLHGAAVPGESELQRRAASLRPGGAVVGQDSSARQRAVERADQGMGRSQVRDRSDDDDLFGGTRRDAHAHRRMARQVHAAVAVGLLPAEPQRARRLLVLLDHRGRDPVEEVLPGVDVVPQRLQERRRPGHHRIGFRASSTRPTASATSSSSRCCRRPGSIRSR